MKIGIIGVGVVGGAILEGLKIINANLDIIGYDKYKNIGSFKKILETDILFVCVPTKFSEQTNQYNKTELQKVLNELYKESALTLWPSLKSFSTKWEPINPSAPVTRIFDILTPY